MPHKDAPADEQAARAVVSHHAQLAQTLNDHANRLLELVEQGEKGEAERARLDLLTWLNGDLLPHAQAEERALYPAAAATPRGALLVDGMLDEHRTILGLVAEIGEASSLIRAAAAARALGAVFATHLTKENDLVVPLLVESDDVSVAELLEGMHALLGNHDAGNHDAGNHDAGNHDAGEHGAGVHPADDHHAASPADAGGCGSNGQCGCGGDAGRGDAEAAVLTIDPRLDVRAIPHERRHAHVLAALDAVPLGGALVLVAPHAPRPLLAEIETRYGGQFGVDWLQSGPEVWQIRLQRMPAVV